MTNAALEPTAMERFPSIFDKYGVKRWDASADLENKIIYIKLDLAPTSQLVREVSGLLIAGWSVVFDAEPIDSVQANAPASTVDPTFQVIGTAGEDLKTGDAVYLDQATGLLHKIKA